MKDQKKENQLYFFIGGVIENEMSEKKRDEVLLKIKG